MFNFKFPFLQKKEEKHFTLVISWGGMRAFYGLGILKALEELGYKDKIDALYGVSAWALLVSYRSAGYSADEILTRFLKSDFLNFSKNLNLIPKSSLLKNTLLKKQMEKELPKNFEDLNIPTFIGCTEVKKGENLILSNGELTSALLGTIAIPWIFPAIERNDHLLIDGGVTDNFPIEVAKKSFPQNKIIGISLNKYRSNPKIKNLFDNLIVSFEIMLRKDIQEKGTLSDIFFCRSLDTPVLEFRTTKLKKLFELWYQDGREKLKKL